jgi:hypothetical protein
LRAAVFWRRRDGERHFRFDGLRRVEQGTTNGLELVSAPRHSSLPESCASAFDGVNDARRLDAGKTKNGAHPKGLSLTPSKADETLNQAMGDRAALPGVGLRRRRIQKCDAIPLEAVAP